ncbi:MAG: LamG-like jellyroll fold domain-containing protein [Chitinivibrionales bacterium]
MRKGIVGIIISLAMISVVFAQIPTDSLIAWYPFTGNVNDSSGKGNNGTVTGATLTTDRFGNANSAYLFNGSGNMITLPILTKLNSSSHVTINAWIKATTGGSILAHWISTSANIGSPIGLVFGPSDNMAVNACVNGGQNITSDTGLITKNQWTMMTLVFDGSISNQANRLYAYIIHSVLSNAA